jgi:mannose-6-phosphate isomerase-like protein (cupin superfamily)
MAFTRVPFGSMPWGQGNHRLEKKKSLAGRGIGLLEFAPGFADSKWCERSHVMYVVEGMIDLEFDEGIVTLSAGQCGVLDRGTRHRAKNTGDEKAIVFVVSDIDVPT